MFIVHDLKNFQQAAGSVVIIGKFDGFHIGHQELIARARGDLQQGEQLLLLTFSKSPQQVLSGKFCPGLNSEPEKRVAAKNLGVDGMIEIPFEDWVRRMPAAEFLDHVLLGRLNAREIAAGPDCAFGYQRSGNIHFLEEQSRQKNFRLRVVGKVQYRGAEVSSTRIRETLAQGRMEEVNDMLGYPFGYCSVVGHGEQLGRRIGYPTINQEVPPDKILPPFGVYAVRVHAGGHIYCGAANVGVKPTVSDRGTAGLETSLLDFDGDLYGTRIRTDLLHYVRPEMRFHSVEELTEQIARDRAVVAAWHREHPSAQR